ncbi:MAG: MucR family transcriptional regulator [Syntrophobacteraceae bacterium]
MTRKLLEVAADIVQAQVATSTMSSEEIVSSLKNVFNALQAMQKSETERTLVEGLKPSDEDYAAEEAHAVDPKASIQDDRIVCLECGAEMKQLTAKHLGSHELSPREYKQKWGFPLKQPLSAKSLTKARSRAAKKRGLPENLKKFQEGRKKQKEELIASGNAQMSGSVLETKQETKAVKSRLRKVKS